MKLLTIVIVTISILTSCNVTTNPDGSSKATLDSKAVLGLAKVLAEK